MKLSPLCMKTYERWIKVDTWHSSHPLDKKRFYRFITTCLQYSRKQISAQELEQDIINRYSGKLDQDYLEQQAEYYSTLFSEIFEFIKVTRR